MNNSVFSKTMENIRRHKDIKLNEKAYLRNVMKPNFKSGVLFSENLMGCEMGKIKVLMNKPVYLGQAILDLSKVVMYEFHYDYMKPKYGGNLKLCYMDTDLLVYHINPPMVKPFRLTYLAKGRGDGCHPPPTLEILTIACLTFCFLLTDRPTLPEYKLKSRIQIKI